jgi:hypothetical protein
MITSLSVSAMPPDKKKSQFTGDLNGDGYTDVVLADRTNYRDLFGFIKVFFGTSRGIDTMPGWTYNCDRSNFLESKYSVSIIGDVNGDGMDELCMLLTNLSNEKSGRSHQDIFLFYGKKEGLGHSPTILKIEQDSKEKVSLRDYFSFDYNGDGFIDILAVSAKRNYKALETGWTDTDRKLLLYRGSDTGINKTFEEIKDVDEIVFKTAGDVNNDGLTDMVIGEPNNKDLVWAQFPGSKNHNVTPKTFLSYKLLAPPTSDRIYYATVWDFNGDKYDDALVMREDNSPLLSLKKPDSTSYTLDFYPGSHQGLRDTVTYTWKMKTPPGVVLNITPCGDLNDDGFGDFLLQKFTLKPKEVPLMEASVLWAEKKGLHLDTSGDFNALFHSIYLVQYGFTSVIALGDVNNDGCADLLLGVETIVYGSKDGNFKSVQLKFLN